MIRLQRIPIPEELKKEGRTKELLGDLKNGTMPDCIYNDIIANGEYEINKYSIEQATQLIDHCGLTVKSDYLKDYQIDDLRKSLLMDKVYNINKPGHGKTLETIMWLRYRTLTDEPANKPMILILCPKSVIETWHYQLKKYWPTYADDCVWWITNYEQLYNAENLSTAKQHQWYCIVLDESHKIKSMQSKITTIAFELTSKYRHCLTGTPVKNRPQDIAAQLKWLDQKSITCFTDFQFAFCDMEKNNWGWKPMGLTKNKTMVDNLQKLLNIYCVGGKEHNMDDITKPEHIKVRLKMDEKVKKLYRKVEGEYDPDLQTRVIDTEYLLEQGIKVSNSAEAAMRRQQLASNPQLFDEKLKNVKFEWIVDWLDSCDEKVIIFSKFAKTIEQLEKYLAKNGYSSNVVTVKREMSPVLRQNRYTAFKKFRRVLLTTFGLTKEGVDGLQENCNYMIFVDREWTASDNEQAEGRINRMGQTRQPIFYILQCTGTIDIKIEKMQLDKGHDIHELLDPVGEDEE